MRYMLVLTYDEAAAQGRPPEPEFFEEMGAFNQAMVDAGVLLAGEGLAPSAQGAMVRFPDRRRSGAELDQADRRRSGAELDQADRRRSGAELDQAEEAVVVDGPFTEAKELIGGYWVLQTESLADAVGWARRAPFRSGETVTVRRIFDPEDFAGVAPDAVMEAEEQMRAQVDGQHGS